jgi:outer membrane protein assembly factor BamB
MVRPAIVALLLLWAPALAQAKEDETDKVTNDRPDRPLQMPPASSEVKEAFDDFERFSKRGAWERALKALYTIPETQDLRFVDGEGGFIITVARKRRAVLSALPPEGQAAYRLFYDADAKKLLDQAEGPTELKTLERVFSNYFLTSVGDDAADRLGDLYFQLGRFDRAAECWLAILRDQPDTDLSPALVSVKAALALSRAGRRAEAEAIRRELADRYAGEELKIGGRTASASEHLGRLLGEEGASAGTAHPKPAPGESEDRLAPDLSAAIPASWQMRFAESVVAGMTPPELVQWEANPLSGAVPAAAVAGGTLYANYLGYVFAIDLESGKLLWRSGAFHNVEVPAGQDQARMLDPKRFAIVASDRYVWSLDRDMKEANQLAAFRLTCRRADGGDVVWQTTNLPDYAPFDLVGVPILAGGTLFVAAKPGMNQQQQGQQHQHVLAIRPHDGKVLWKAEVGTLRQGQRYYYYGMPDTTPQPRLIYRSGAVYLDTHIGVLARLDAESGELSWGFGYQTEPAQSQGRFIFFGGMMQPQDPKSISGPPAWSDEALLVKGAQSDRIAALEPERQKVLWDRPIAKSARLLGADDRAVFLGGPEISALDLKTRELLWATRLPGGSAEARVLVRPGGLWQLTPRGIFELDPRSGRVRRIFRGDDAGSDGGDLYLGHRMLLAVTNRTISAYPSAAAVPEAPTTTKTRESDD